MNNMWIKCECKHAYQKDTCLKTIGLPSRNMITILNSTMNMLRGEGEGDLHDHPMSIKKNFNLTMSKISI